MPEGHVIHHLADVIHDRFARRIVAVSSPQGRFSESAAQLDGLRLLGAEAVGKHLFIRFTGDQWVHVHLGIYGRFTFGDPPVPEPTGQIRLRMVSRNAWTDLRGASRCELIDAEHKADVEARLGDDPLRSDATGERAYERVRRSRAPIATLVMDQSIVSGVGNIFRAEVLFRTRTDPFREGRSLDGREWNAIWADLVELMRYAYEVGHIDSVADEHTPEAMGREPREDRHGGEVYVYRRAGQPCLVCGTTVLSTTLAGRNLFWCPKCQATNS